MPPQLFYFSGTGNSLELARDIARNLDDTELMSISTVSEETIHIMPNTKSASSHRLCTLLPYLLHYDCWREFMI